jgi:alpha-beta hydrolase superfamily lysophospholipase
MLAGFALSSQAACSLSHRRDAGSRTTLVAEVRAELRPIRAVAPGSLSRSQQAYLDFYGILADPEDYRFGTFDSGELALACQIFHSSAKEKGTVILVHGYLDHSGSLRHLINRLAAEGYSVAVYDQPGHGLSGGKRVSAEDFSIYEAAFSDFLSLVRSRLPPPYDVVAHSMGSTVVVDYLLSEAEAPLRRVVLLTPLIRDATPKLYRRIGHSISPLIDYLPRISENSSSDPGYADSTKADPLQPRVVSTHWSLSFCRWQRQNLQVPPSKRRPLVIEAAIDTVIDRPYCERWMRHTFPQGRYVEIEDGRHELLNEAEPIRERVLDLICAELKN